MEKSRDRVEEMVSRALGVNRRIVIPYYEAAAGESVHQAGPTGFDAEAIPPRELWVAYGESGAEYIRSGQEHSQQMFGKLAQAGCDVQSLHRVLDFGCAAGRMTRHVARALPGAQVWGADISADHIEWADRHLGALASFFTSTSVPHLPFRDDYFDLIYAGSVFTHIDDLHLAWFLELNRIVRPGGWLFISVQDESVLKIAKSNSWSDPWLKRYTLSGKAAEATERLLSGQIDWFTTDRDKDPHVFYAIDPLLHRLKRTYRSVDVVDQGYGHMPVLLLRP